MTSASGNPSMLIDLLFLPVHMLVAAPDVALHILAVCNVLVVELVLTKNSFGFLAHLQQKAFLLGLSSQRTVSGD